MTHVLWMNRTRKKLEWKWIKEKKGTKMFNLFIFRLSRFNLLEFFHIQVKHQQSVAVNVKYSLLIFSCAFLDSHVFIYQLTSTAILYDCLANATIKEFTEKVHQMTSKITKNLTQKTTKLIGIHRKHSCRNSKETPRKEGRETWKNIPQKQIW